MRSILSFVWLVMLPAVVCTEKNLRWAPLGVGDCRQYDRESDLKTLAAAAGAYSGTVAARRSCVKAYSPECEAPYLVEIEQASGYVVLCDNPKTTTAEVIVAFRGTNSKWQLFVEALSVLVVPKVTTPLGRVQKYFYDQYQKIFPGIEEHVELILGMLHQKHVIITVTGHSLGGAIAALAAAQLRRSVPSDTTVRLVTYGEPRVGDWSFAKTLTELLEGCVHRVVHDADVVPHLPTCLPQEGEGGHNFCSKDGGGPYHHGDEIFFTRMDVNATQSAYRTCEGLPLYEDVACANKPRNFTWSELHNHLDHHLTYHGREVGAWGRDGCPLGGEDIRPDCPGLPDNFTIIAGVMNFTRRQRDERHDWARVMDFPGGPDEPGVTSCSLRQLTAVGDVVYNEYKLGQWSLPDAFRMVKCPRATAPPVNMDMMSMVTSENCVFMARKQVDAAALDTFNCPLLAGASPESFNITFNGNVPTTIFDVLQVQFSKVPDESIFAPPEDFYDPGATEAATLRSWFGLADGHEWYRQRGWDPPSDEPPCNWFGIKCGGCGIHCAVSNIALPKNGLRGNLAKLLGALKGMRTLEELDLSGNTITGRIPEDLEDSLPWVHHLDLSHNNLTGELPDSIADMKRLVSLDLSHNNLHGRIPDSWALAFANEHSTNLQWMSLKGNLIECPLPEWIRLRRWPADCVSV